jgi:hypothetical protein
MAVTIDDVIEAATNGVIRALDARKATQQGAVTECHDVSTGHLVRSGSYIVVGAPPSQAAMERSSVFKPPILATVNEDLRREVA